MMQTIDLTQRICDVLFLDCKEYSKVWSDVREVVP
jgi:hypothetical protein